MSEPLADHLAPEDPVEKIEIEWATIVTVDRERFTGRVTEVQMFGSPSVRLEQPDGDGVVRQTLYFAPGGIMAVHPCDEEHAKRANVGKWRPLATTDGGAK